MSEQTLTIELPTPFGAAARLGLLRAVPMPTSTTWRGPVLIVQTGRQTESINGLVHLVANESARRGQDIPWSVFTGLCIERGAICRAEVTGVTFSQDLPSCQHLGFCGGLRRYKYAWSLENPGPVREGLPLAAIAGPLFREAEHA